MSSTWVLAFLGAACVVACSASNNLPAGEPNGGAASAAGKGETGGAAPVGGASAGGEAGKTSGGASGSGGAGVAIGGAGGGGDLDSLIYAHTDDELFQLDAKEQDLALTSLGKFDCIGKGKDQDTAITDLAVDSEKNIWAVSAAYVYRIEIQDGVAHCAETIKLKKPNDNVRYYGLTFAPAGVLDPDKEVLVAGNTAGEMWAVSADGSVELSGTFGSVPSDDGNGHDYDKDHRNKPWELSGDIVFLANGGQPLGYATVRDCPKPPSTSGCNEVNTLIEIDVAKMNGAKSKSVTKAVRGQIVERAGCATPAFENFGNMYGIAAWDDKVYAFSRTGNLVDVSVSDGTGCVVKTYPDFDFAGAGVTTLAPVLPPPPK